MKHLSQYPLFALIMMIGALAMLVPSLHAAKLGELVVMRTFFYFALLVLVLAVILGLAMMNRDSRITARANLVTVLLVYLVMPVFLSMPLISLVPSLGPVQGYFEMLSALTTTGASVLPQGADIAEPLHIWRGLVAWLGGLFILIIAMAIMEPMNLGGFEIRSLVSGAGAGSRQKTSGDSAERLLKHIWTIGPVYGIATLVLMVLLMIAGDRAYVAAVHAMSIMSTSGISPIGGLENASSGRFGELLMLFFLLFAISHRSFKLGVTKKSWEWVRNDVEVKLMLIAIISIPLILFLRHWIAAFEVSNQEDTVAAFQALWGGVFTVMSFLTTTGFESADWHAARSWSGMGAPGIVLMMLAFTGGGIATTAGGVKLLRIFALYKHGTREMERLVNPSSVGGAGMAARRFRREGAFIAWVFLMLLLVAVAIVMLILSFQGVPFETSVVMSISALTNTGPLANAFSASNDYALLGNFSQITLCLAMILGRVEVLVLIALFNPRYWVG